MTAQPKQICYDDLLFIAQNMREDDKREIYATRWSKDPAALAKDCLISSAAFGWTFGKNVPIAAVGAFPMWPGCWSVWMFATPRFPEVGLSMTRFIKKRMIPAIRNSGYNRCQCYSIFDHHEAHKWLESLGAVRESTAYNFGEKKEDFYVYTWTDF